MCTCIAAAVTSDATKTMQRTIAGTETMPQTKSNSTPMLNAIKGASAVSAA